MIQRATPSALAASSSGSYYNYQRDLDAASGRYVQSDPIGLAGGISTYGYVGGRPLTVIDPHGLEGVGPWTFPAGPVRQAYEQPPIQARAPDYVRVQLSLYVFGMNRTFSRSGNMFVGGNLQRSYPPSAKAQASISFGWINSCATPNAEKVDNHLEGFGMAGAAGYYGFGGALNWSPIDKSVSTELGFGIGGGVSPGGSPLVAISAGAMAGENFNRKSRGWTDSCAGLYQSI